MPSVSISNINDYINIATIFHTIIFFKLLRLLPFYVPLVFVLIVLSVVDVLLPQAISNTLTDVVVIGFRVVVVVKVFGIRSTDGCVTINNRNINFSNVENCKISDLDSEIHCYN